MKKVLGILFGRGWYIILYTISYFWYFVFPGLSITYLFKDYWEVAKQGGDFSGGLGMIIPLIVTPFTLSPVLLISSILWVITLSYGVWEKIFIVFGISIVLPIILGLIGAGIKNETLFFLYYIGYFGMFIIHLVMLRKFIDRKK